MNISGRMKVKTLRKEFKEEFGLVLRVYEGRSFAEDDSTLASIRKGDSKGGEFSPKKNTKVGNLEDKIQDMFGIKTQIAGSDDSYLCDNDLTLKAALEEDEKKLLKKEKKSNKKIPENNLSDSPVESSSLELTDEEKEWVEEYADEDAPENVRYSRNFMLKAIDTDEDWLEYTSDELKNDRSIVFLAVEKNAESLKYASNKLKNDRALVLKAIEEDGSVYEYISDELKNDKEIIFLAMEGSTRVIEYSPDNIKSDVSIALESIKLANDKNKDNIFDNRLNNGEIESFDAKIYEDEKVINEICSVSLSPFLFSISERGGLSENTLNTLMKYSDTISKALKNDFNTRLEYAKNVVNKDWPVDEKITECKVVFHYYCAHSFINFDKDFNLGEGTDFDSNLTVKLAATIRDEIVVPLQEQINSFEDGNALMGSIYKNHDNADLFNDYLHDELKANEIANLLLNHIDAASISDISYACIRGEDWSLEDDCPDIYESLISAIEKKITTGVEGYNAILNTDEVFYASIASFSTDFKENLLKFINDMDDDEKEEYYLDDILEYLED